MPTTYFRILKSRLAGSIAGVGLLIAGLMGPSARLCFAQDQPGNVSGIWQGTMTHAADGYAKSWHLTLTLETTKTGLTGTTKLVAGDRWVVFSLLGKRSGQTITTQESQILHQSAAPTGWCRNRVMELHFTAPNHLSGGWRSATEGCGPGQVELIRLADTISRVAPKGRANQRVPPVRVTRFPIGLPPPIRLASTMARREHQPRVAPANQSRRDTASGGDELTPLGAAAQSTSPIALPNVLFETSRADLLPVSYAALDQLAAWLLARPTVKIRLEGHTDQLGEAAQNLQLSQDRVTAIKRYLLRKGIAPDRLTTLGYGDSRPICESPCAANRRVEFVLTEP